MQFIGDMLQAFFAYTEVKPEEISEMELIPEGLPGVWWIHVRPDHPWFAQVSYSQGEWWVILHDYL